MLGVITDRFADSNLICFVVLSIERSGVMEKTWESMILIIEESSLFFLQKNSFFTETVFQPLGSFSDSSSIKNIQCNTSIFKYSSNVLNNSMFRR